MSKLVDILVHNYTLDLFNGIVERADRKVLTDSYLAELSQIVSLTPEEAAKAIGVSIDEFFKLIKISGKKRENTITALVNPEYDQTNIDEYNRRRYINEQLLKLAEQKAALYEEKRRAAGKTLSYVKSKKLTIEEAADISGMSATEYIDYVRDEYYVDITALK